MLLLTLPDRGRRPPFVRIPDEDGSNGKGRTTWPSRIACLSPRPPPAPPAPTKPLESDLSDPGAMHSGLCPHSRERREVTAPKNSGRGAASSSQRLYELSVEFSLLAELED